MCHVKLPTRVVKVTCLKLRAPACSRELATAAAKIVHEDDVDDEDEDHDDGKNKDDDADADDDKLS